MKHALLLFSPIRPIVLNILLFSIVKVIVHLVIAEFVWNELCICGDDIAGCCLFSSWSRYKAKMSISTSISIIYLPLGTRGVVAQSPEPEAHDKSD